MSARRLAWLVCDGTCDDEDASTYELALLYAVETLKVAREIARERGWTCRKGKDYCSECSE